jgi:hypothetical protein
VARERGWPDVAELDASASDDTVVDQLRKLLAVGRQRS